jgi:hypothetical protein
MQCLYADSLPAHNTHHSQKCLHIENLATIHMNRCCKQCYASLACEYRRKEKAGENMKDAQIAHCPSVTAYLLIT